MLCEGALSRAVMSQYRGQFALMNGHIQIDRLESGTVNTSGIIGLSAGVGFVLQNTPKKLYLHEMQLCDYLYQKLCGIRGVTLYSDRSSRSESLPRTANCEHSVLPPGLPRRPISPEDRY